MLQFTKKPPLPEDSKCYNLTMVTKCMFMVSFLYAL